MQHQSQSLALRHVFFAERELSNIPGLPAAEPRSIASAGIVGGGTMGTGIAIAFADAGIPVTVVEPDSAQAERSKQRISETFTSNAQRGRISQDEAARRIENVRFAHSYDALANVDVAIEAVFENLDVKKQVFEQLDIVCKPSAILASNTSTLDIDEMAAATKRPENVIGTHFFVPANIMRLLEIVRGAATSPQTLLTGIALAKRLRKIGIVSGNAFGFIANSMYFEYLRQAIALAEEGVSLARVDAALRDFGFPMGPLAVADLSGLDVLRFIEQCAGAPLSRTPFIEKLVDRGWLGQKSGRGFFLYDATVGRGREALPDPEADELVADLARQQRIASQPNASDEQIVDRCVQALIDKGNALLRSGLALRAGDIDVAWIYGFGFPPYRGGPMWYGKAPD